jgi:hypothetical protein
MLARGCSFQVVGDVLFDRRWLMDIGRPQRKTEWFDVCEKLNHTSAICQIAGRGNEHYRAAQQSQEVGAVNFVALLSH